MRTATRSAMSALGMAVAALLWGVDVPSVHVVNWVLGFLAIHAFQTLGEIITHDHKF